MTAVLIEPLALPISSLISSANGLSLDTKSAEILEFCQGMSAECWSGYIAGKLVCCWGLIPPSLLSNQAYLWMHTTPAVRGNQFLFVRHSQRIMEVMLAQYPRIVGHCEVSAEDSIRWLRWLGATFDEPTGQHIPFVIRKKTQ